MSAFHFDRRRLRRTVWATLVVWLFGLTAGVVNACVLTAKPAERAALYADLSVHDPREGSPAGADHGSRHDQEGAFVAHHGHAQDSGNVSCLKFCDDESSAIIKVKLPSVDLGSGHPAVVEPWNAIASAGGSGLRQSLERPGSRGPPLVIRFLHLTL